MHQRRQLGRTLFVLSLLIGGFSAYFIVAEDDAWTDIIDYGLCSLIALILAPFIVLIQRIFVGIRPSDDGQGLLGNKSPMMAFSFIINWGSFLIAIPLSLIILTYPEVVSLSQDIHTALQKSGIAEQSLARERRPPVGTGFSSLQV